MRPMPLAAIALILAMPAVAPAKARPKPADKVVEMKPVAGAEPRACIPINTIRETRVRDDRTIDFVTNGRRIYRNTLPNACPQLGSERAFGYATALTQLCSVDIITVISRSNAPFVGASCGLGAFQLMEKATP